MTIADMLIAQGKEAGLQEGKQAGLLEGKQKGLLEGKQEGKRENALEIATRMLEQGFEDALILSLTYLTPEQLQALKAELGSEDE